MNKYKISIRFEESPVVSYESVCDLIIKADSLENAVRLVTESVTFPFVHRILRAYDVTIEKETP